MDIFEKWTFSIEKTNDNKNLHGENVQLRLQELNRRQDKGIKRVLIRTAKLIVSAKPILEPRITRIKLWIIDTRHA